MKEPSHPLNRPLPPDVAAGESAFIQFYQQYVVFSWPWAWRRTLVFGLLGLLAGALFGASHGLHVEDVGEGVIVTLACTTANLFLVGAGPMLAAFVRHRAWPLRLERTLIVAAVIVGMVLGVVTDYWASGVHDDYMAAHGSTSQDSDAHEPDMHSVMRRLLDIAPDLLILFVASGGLALQGYFTEKKRWAEHSRRLELEGANLRLTLLQAQVEPHFLFNTLASVRSLVATDPQRAARTIDALAQHLRTTLPKIRAETGVAHSTLGEQFAICASYLALMKERVGERLRVEITLPPELSELPFPPLLLISLVENAIKHGVEPKPGVTHVWLAAQIAGERGAQKLEVSVQDDGAGLRLGMGEGTGLTNIRAQLRTRYDSAASLELFERDGGGVVARLIVPLEGKP
jgi:hypothetical protein